ncbi:plasmid maintenance protein [Borreliella garinii]|uniref:plasmid maintenance protein n=1 Tax=Borreliella garinii TaxID=29519 RepID=UPI001AEFEF2C
MLKNTYKNRLEQNAKNVNNTKKFIFKELHLEILGQNSKKPDPNLKEISDLRLSSHIGRKEIEYQRLLKVSWLLEKKYQKYLKSQKRETYQIEDIVASVNSMLVKDNSKPVTKRTIQRDLQKLIKMNLVANFSKSLGKDNGGFSIYKVNSDIWRYRIEILRAYFENEIRKYTQDKIIVTICRKEIDEHTFTNSNPSMSTQSMSTLLYNKKDINKIKNSTEENFFENIEKNYEEKNLKKEQQNLIEKNGEKIEIKKEKKQKLKFSYEKSFEEYQENKLTTKYKIPVNFFSKLKGLSNAVNTYKNALINLEYYLKYLIPQYGSPAILEII